MYKRERLTCGIGMLTQLSAMFTIIVPHVAVLAVLQAVIFVPWVNLNTTGRSKGHAVQYCTGLLQVLAVSPGQPGERQGLGLARIPMEQTASLVPSTRLLLVSLSEVDAAC